MELFLHIAAEHLDVQRTTWPPIRGQSPRALACKCQIDSQSSSCAGKHITGPVLAVGNWPWSSVEASGTWHTGTALPFAPGTEMLFYILGQHKTSPPSSLVNACLTLTKD